MYALCSMQMHAHSCKTLKPEGLAKYAVDANLFRLGSTNPKKNSQTPDAFWLGVKTLDFFGFFKNVRKYLNKKKFVQMKHF